MRGEIFTDRIGIIPEYHTGGADEFHGVARQRIVFPVSQETIFSWSSFRSGKTYSGSESSLNGIQVLV